MVIGISTKKYQWNNDRKAFHKWGNWTYTSGVGNFPRDQNLDVKGQAKMCDPDGTFQKLWLSPEDF